MKKRLSLLAFLIACMLLVPSVVLASYEYYIPIEVYNNDSEAVSGMPVLVSINNSQLADYGYILASGLDTAMLEGSNSRDYLVVDNKTFIMIPSLDSYQKRTYNYRLGQNPAQTLFTFSAGFGGNVTISDDDDLELGDNFSIEFEGYIKSFTASFPTIVNTNSSVSTSGTSHTVNLPIDIISGNLLIVTFSGFKQIDYGGVATTITWPAGWTEIFQQAEVNLSGTDHNLAVGAAYRIANGGEGASITVTTSHNLYGAHQTFQIFGYEGVPESANGGSTAFTATFDVPSLSPTWGTSRKTLWLAGAGTGKDAALTLSSSPTNYTNSLLKENDQADIAVARREYRTANEDAGTFVVSATSYVNVPFSIAIGGISNTLIKKDSAIVSYADGGYITAEILGATTKTISAAYSGDGCIVKAYADGTNFKLDIDGVNVNSTALGGVSVPLNGNDWIVGIPYFDYYKHSVNGTQEAWYQPNTMVTGTQLTDRSGNGHHGTINWGSNPSTIVVTIGGMQPFSAFTATDEEEENEAPWVVPDTGNVPTVPTPGATGVGLPLYVNFKSAADSLDWSVPVMYSVAFIIISVVLGAAGLVAMGTGWGFTIGCGATMAFFSQVQDGGGYRVLPIGLAIAIVIVSIILGWLWSRT